MSEKIEKLFSQPKELFEAVDFTNLNVINENEFQEPRFIEGENYALKGVACDGFQVESKVYKLIKVVNDFYGSPLNSLIVKQIGGKQDLIFTLSKTDCMYHGIEYENGLQLFPKDLSWIRVKEQIPFDSHNLATTPLSNIDNTIRFVLLKLNGFKDYSDGYILTPSGHLITEGHFMQTLRVSTKNEPIVYGNGFIIRNNTNLNIRVVYPNHLIFNHGNFISSEDTIYVLIKLKRHSNSINSDSLDGAFGVEPQYFNNINPNDFFSISWDELGAYTVEEYEAKKAEEAKRDAEMAKIREEEYKRKIEAEEQKIREKRERKDDIRKAIKGYGFKFPTFPTFFKPKDGFYSSVSSIDMMMDEVDEYFNSVEKSLIILDEDLNTLSKIYERYGTSEPVIF